MKFNHILLASDFDGTFVTDEGIVLPEVSKALHYFIREGGFFTVCTGRTYQGFNLYSPDYINAPVLLANGAAAYDYPQDQYLFFDGLGQESFSVLRLIRDSFPTASIEMYPKSKTKAYAIHMNYTSEQHFTNQGIRFSEVKDPAEAEEPWSKVMIESSDLSLKIQELLSDHPEVDYLKTTGNYIEVLKKGNNKGIGLLKLAQILGCDPGDVFAAGDGYNDVDMLTASAGGFVPENGSSEALAAAKYVTRSNNDGCIANAIEILDGLYSK